MTPTREPKKRNVTAESRALTSKASGKVLGAVDSFSNLKKYCSKFSPEFLVDLSDNHVIKIMKLNRFPPDIGFSLLIKDDFCIEAYAQHTKVDTRDLLHGFSCTVTRYSAIDHVLDRLRNTPVN